MRNAFDQNSTAALTTSMDAFHDSKPETFFSLIMLPIGIRLAGVHIWFFLIDVAIPSVSWPSQPPCLPKHRQVGQVVCSHALSIRYQVSHKINSLSLLIRVHITIPYYYSYHHFLLSQRSLPLCAVLDWAY